MNRKFAVACAQLLKRENLGPSMAAVVIVGCVSAVAIRSYSSSSQPPDELTISAVDHAMKGCVYQTDKNDIHGYDRLTGCLENEFPDIPSQGVIVPFQNAKYLFRIDRTDDGCEQLLLWKLPQSPEKKPRDPVYTVDVCG